MKVYRRRKPRSSFLSCRKRSNAVMLWRNPYQTLAVNPHNDPNNSYNRMNPLLFHRCRKDFAFLSFQSFSNDSLLLRNPCQKLTLDRGTDSSNTHNRMIVLHAVACGRKLPSSFPSFQSESNVSTLLRSPFQMLFLDRHSGASSNGNYMMFLRVRSVC